MDEIGLKQKLSCRFKSCLTVILILYCFQVVSPSSPQARSDSQKKTLIEILAYDVLSIDAAIDPNLVKLIGNVSVKHNDALMWCDSAYLYEKRNEVTAYGNVKIEQGDTLKLFGDYLKYDANSEKAYVTGEVKLLDKETVLFTNILNYNVAERTAYYDTGGNIISNSDTLKSKKGIYYSYDKMFHFSENVTINGTDYSAKADTMHYNTEKEIVYFLGPTEILGDSIRLFAHGGWYNTKEKVSRIWDNAVIDNYQQIIEGDSLYYNEVTGYGLALGNVCITDTANSSMVKGNRVIYMKEPESYFVTESALYIMTGESDSLYLHADTLRSITISLPIDSASYTVSSPGSFRLIRAYYGTKVYSNGFQAKCDSLSYSFRDSTIRMYGDPILWSEENQLTADSMTLFTKSGDMDKMELYNNSLVVSQVDSLRFNQIKGRNLTGYFLNNEIYKVYVEGNGESIYFLIDNEELIGVNYSKSSNIEILVDDGKIKQVTEFGNPDGYLDPPLKKSLNELKIQGFKWFNTFRPLKKDDVFIRN